MLRLQGDGAHRRFLEFWCAKEARMKLTGEGFGLDPQEIVLALEGGRPVGVTQPEGPDCRLVMVDMTGRCAHDAVCALCWMPIP